MKLAMRSWIIFGTDGHDVNAETSLLACILLIAQSGHPSFGALLAGD
jgi:hypothetical protein